MSAVDLSIIVTSLNEASWLTGCLPSVRAACRSLAHELIVVDIASTDATRAVAESHDAAVVACANGGFSWANNRGYAASSGRYVLLLNPDTEVRRGDFAELVAWMDRHPSVGVLGCRQLTPAGEVYPTMRRFATLGRLLAEALGSERFAPRAGQRVLDLDEYERETSCDWVIGSFMLMRREALAGAGTLDERFFLYSEEEDLCRRIRGVGWEIVHVPHMTIVHYVGKAGIVPRFEAQRAFARLQYAEKHFGSLSRRLLPGVMASGYALRLGAAALAGRAEQRDACRAGLNVVRGSSPAPFVEPPRTSLAAGVFREVAEQLEGSRPGAS